MLFTCEKTAFEVTLWVSNVTGPLWLMSPNFRCLQHRCLHLRYLSGLPLPSAELYSTDAIQSEIQLPKHRCPLECVIITRVHVKLETVLVPVHAGKDRNGKNCALLESRRQLSEEVGIEPAFWLLLYFVF